jgi:predicted hydrocarbon binding protein
MRTAEVPPELQSVFEKAAVSVKEYFDSLHSVPGRGRVEVGRDRFILARTDSLSLVLRRVLTEIYGEHGSDQLLYAFGKAVGRAEARKFFSGFGLKDPLEKFGFGPTYFAFSGWAFVNLLHPTHLVSDETFVLVFANQQSFEAEGFRLEGEGTQKSICHINAGYLTGWCEESFEIPLETRELFCSARGDPLDLFLMTHRKMILRATENAARLIEKDQDLTVEAILAG